MDSRELRIYTCLTHPTAREDYRIEDNGTKLYVLERGVLIYLEGEGLDKMSARNLYYWYLNKISHWRQVNF